jgi:hypothetical protein
MQSCYEQSGSDLDGGILRLSGGFYTVTNTGGVWAWLSLAPPHPVRALRAQGDAAWRTITIEWLAEMSVAATSAEVRVFALPSASVGLDLAAGLAGPYPYCEMIWNAVGAVRDNDTMTPIEVGYETLEGESFPIVYLRTAVKSNGNCKLYSARRTEGI